MGWIKIAGTKLEMGIPEGHEEIILKNLSTMPTSSPAAKTDNVDGIDLDPELISIQQ